MAKTKRDYYEVLEIERTVTVEEIKKSYRRLAVKHHPDKNPDDPQAEERFKELGEAYDVLSDDNKRAAYDRYGHAAFAQGAGPGAGQGFPRSIRPFSAKYSARPPGAEAAVGFSSNFSAAAVARARTARDASAAPTCATTCRSSSRKPPSESRKRSRFPASIPARNAAGRGAEEGLLGSHLPHLPRPGPGDHLARIFPGLADVPELPRLRPDHRQAVQSLPRRRPRGTRDEDQTQNPRRHRARPRASAPAATAKPASAAARGATSTWSSTSRSTPSSTGRRRTFIAKSPSPSSSPRSAAK